jgi:hypothetical protein
MAGKKSGFLTEPRRDYLKTPETERKEKYSDSQKGQFDAAISEQANLAIEDLILIARKYRADDLKSVFPPGSIVDLIDALMDRVGMEEVAGRDRYYEILLKAIEHRIHEKYREQGRFFKLESSDYPIMPSKPAFKDLRAYTRK